MRARSFYCHKGRYRCGSGRTYRGLQKVVTRPVSGREAPSLGESGILTAKNAKGRENCTAIDESRPRPFLEYAVPRPECRDIKGPFHRTEACADHLSMAAGRERFLDNVSRGMERDRVVEAPGEDEGGDKCEAALEALEIRGG